MHDFYDPVNLQRLHTALPLLYGQLERLLTEIHTCWQLLVADPAPSNEDMILSFLDLIDLLDSFSEICKKLRVEYHTRTGRQFFKRIDNFGYRRTQLQIALAMYDDLTSQ